MTISGIPRSPLTAAQIALASKKSVFEALPAYFRFSKRITGTTYGAVYKQTIDFTDVETLEVYGYYGSIAGTGSFKLSIDGVSKFEDTGEANGAIVGHSIDCSAITGNKVLLIEAKNSGASHSYLYEYSMYAKEV